METYFRTYFINERRLPLVVGPGGAGECDFASLLAACSTERGRLRALLLESGALLFRGFDVRSSAEFGSFLRAFSGRESLGYAGGASPRTGLGSGVYTSTEYPPHYAIPLHNELSYSHAWPEHVYLFCHTPPRRGGETPVGDSRRILESVARETLARFKAKGVLYVRNFHGGDGRPGLSWQAAFETDSRAEVEAHCRRGDARIEWLDGDRLRVRQVRPATALHPLTGEEVWFNQADGFHASVMGADAYRELAATTAEEDFPANAYFGDGTPFDVAELEAVRASVRAEAVTFAWRRGDLLVLDNLLAAHGRMPFEGPRKILLSMT